MRWLHLPGSHAEHLGITAQELLSKVEEHPGDRSVALDLLAADALITLPCWPEPRRRPSGWPSLPRDCLR
jgi:hypothetical protein